MINGSISKLNLIEVIFLQRNVGQALKLFNKLPRHAAL